MKSDISGLSLELDNVNEAVNQYDNHLKPLLDKHAPQKSKRIVIRPNTKWYNKNIRDAKVVKRRLERNGENLEKKRIELSTSNSVDTCRFY